MQGKTQKKTSHVDVVIGEIVTVKAFEELLDGTEYYICTTNSNKTFEAVSFRDIPLEEGTYAVVLKVNCTEDGRYTFVIAPATSSISEEVALELKDSLVSLLVEKKWCHRNIALRYIDILNNVYKSSKRPIIKFIKKRLHFTINERPKVRRLIITKLFGNILVPIIFYPTDGIHHNELIFYPSSPLFHEKRKEENLPREKTQITDTCAYPAINKEPVVFNFKGEVRKTGESSQEKSKLKRPISGTLHVHGILEIPKWHLVVLFHYLHSEQGKSFEEMLSMGIPQDCIQETCQKKYDLTGKKTCYHYPSCLYDGIYAKANRQLLKHMKNYWDEAIRFLQRKGHKKPVTRGRKRETKLNVGMRFLEKDFFGGKVLVVEAIKSHEGKRLVMRGIAYSDNPGLPYKPEIHVNIVTFFSSSKKYAMLKEEEWDFIATLELNQEVRQ